MFSNRAMEIYFLSLASFLALPAITTSSECGCKTLRACYQNMLDTLLDRDEVPCIENAAIGGTTITIFLKALQKFCGDVVSISDQHLTYEGRHLYEVVISHNAPDQTDKTIDKPVIVLEAGQQGGDDVVMLGLFMIEQLIACEEYNEMITKVRWVILPCTNPDGMEYSRFNRITWKKNVKPSEDSLSFGVDITRNFDNQWGSCKKVEGGFSPIYPGISPGSENETIFIKKVLNDYKKDTKVYLSLRRDGHAILYNYGYTKNTPPNQAKLVKIAGEVAQRVNQRTGGMNLMVNTSIYDYEGKPHCGHSVDYAFDLGISLSYEMRVFLRSDNRIMSKFQALPRGYETALRNGYFSGIRELYNAITNEKKYGKV